MYDFAFPMAGMFLWMRINFESHPLFSKVDHQRLAKALWVYLTTKPYRVLVSPGMIFSPTEKIKKEKGWQYFRLCFAAVDDDMLEKHSVGVVEGFKSFWTKKWESDIDDILKDEDVTVREAMGSGIGQIGGPC
jgi:DNA-binding transcriptional MocR family regulator